MNADVVGWWLGAAPGIALVLRTAWQRRALHRRRVARAAGGRRNGEPGDAPERRFDLWRRPHCFVRGQNHPDVAAAKREILAFRPKLVRGLLGGTALALAGGVLGRLVAQGLA